MSTKSKNFDWQCKTSSQFPLREKKQFRLSMRLLPLLVAQGETFVLILQLQLLALHLLRVPIHRQLLRRVHRQPNNIPDHFRPLLRLQHVLQLGMNNLLHPRASIRLPRQLRVQSLQSLPFSLRLYLRLRNIHYHEIRIHHLRHGSTLYSLVFATLESTQFLLESNALLHKQ